jgi:hypothetical protein
VGFHSVKKIKNSSNEIVIVSQGPNSNPDHAWGKTPATNTDYMDIEPITEVLPTTEGIKDSWFRVIRAVAEVECDGFLDIVNAWDKVFISIGPCQWAIGLPKKPTKEDKTTLERGELGALLAYYKSVYKDDYQTAFGAYGIEPEFPWQDIPNEGAGDLFCLHNAYKYTAYLTYPVADKDNPGATIPKPIKTKDAADEFRTWHWFYRFQIAARTLSSFRQAMLDFISIRIRDILQIPWPVKSDPPLPIGILGGTYTAERCVAMLLRWHIFKPSHIATSGRAASELQEAYQEAVELAKNRGGGVHSPINLNSPLACIGNS